GGCGRPAPVLTATTLPQSEAQRRRRTTSCASSTLRFRLMDRRGTRWNHAEFRSALLRLTVAECLRFSSYESKTPWIQGFGGSPNGIRTRVTAVRGRRPRPLDDRAAATPG